MQVYCGFVCLVSGDLTASHILPSITNGWASSHYNIKKLQQSRGFFSTEQDLAKQGSFISSTAFEHRGNSKCFTQSLKGKGTENKE